MAEVGVERYDEYIDYLEMHPDEFVELFNTVLINVTAFFRDPPAWEYLATERRAGAPRRAAQRRLADPGLVGRLRLRRGGLHGGDGAGARAR